MSKVGGVPNVMLSGALLKSAASARKTYAQHQEETKAKAERAVVSGKRTAIEAELEEMKVKAKRTKEIIQDLEKDADNLAEKAATTSSIPCIIKSNALRNEAKKKSVVLSELEDCMKKKRKELSSF